jgi:hypothetical protein
MMSNQRCQHLKPLRRSTDPSSEEQGQASEEHLDKTQECKPSGHKRFVNEQSKITL